MEFKAWPKIPRLNKNCIITEKIDGTNACVAIDDAGNVNAQSRKRVITGADDNFGFAYWVEQNAKELKRLGPGYHYGEWWGGKIQRGYGLTEKRFSLFNVNRWQDVHLTNPDCESPVAPPCCHVVPVLAHGNLVAAIDMADTLLRHTGSRAAPGFMKPEGYMVWLDGHYFKVVLENADIPKSLVAA